MKVLVFGGTRFVGLSVVQLLLEQGVEVTVASRRAPRCKGTERMRYLRVERTDEAQLRSLAEEGPWDVILDQIGFSARDADLLVRTLSKSAGHIVYTSSAGVYDGVGGFYEAAFDALQYSYSLHTRVDYEEGKRGAEAVLLQTSTVPVTILRPSVIVDKHDPSSRLYDLVLRVAGNEDIHLPNPAAKISLLDRTDAAQAIVAAMVKQVEGVVNLASPKPIAVGELCRLVASSLEVELSVFSDSPDGLWTPAYAQAQDGWLRVAKAEQAGFGLREIEQWLPAHVRIVAATIK